MDKRAYNLQWRQKNTEHIKEKSAQYYKENREVILQRKKDYLSKNREAINKKQRDYFASNKEKWQKWRVNYKNSPRSRYTRYKEDAKKRGYVFDLTFEQFVEFWGKPCFYCGDEIKTIGLDRIDNLLGYSLGNVVPCCSDCNYMKSQKTVTQFIEKCKKIIKFLR